MPGISANTEAALIKDALELNAAVCAPPLPQCQVLAMARCVWKYKERGTLWADDGGARVLLDIWEFDSLADEPEAIALLILLKLAHGAREADFAIVPESMATAGLLEDWGKKSYMRTRDILLERGFIERTHEGGGRGNPHRYRLLTSVKGAPRDHNIKETLLPSFPPSGVAVRSRTFVQVRYHLDGSTTVTAGSELTLFDLSALPLHPVEVLRRTTRTLLGASPRGAQTKLVARVIAFGGLF